MRQVMPHRNNIELRRTKSKRYFFKPVEKPFSRLWNIASPTPLVSIVACREFAARTGII